jgi:DNA polymerase-1
VALDQAAAYAAEDADITLQLHHVLYPQIAREAGLERVYREIEMPVSLVLRKMERTGVLIDDALLPRKATRSRRGSSSSKGRRTSWPAAFNLGSPKQIGQIFFEKLQLPVVKKTPSGAPSTDEEVLQKLAEDYPLPKLLLEHRGLSKLKSTYTDKLPRMVNPPQAACTRTMRRPWRSPAGSRRTSRTCRTFPCARPKAGAFAKRSSRRRAIGSCRPTIRRSNCASWRTSPAMRRCCARSRTARTFTARPRPKCSA